jgi:hypothetical protein
MNKIKKKAKTLEVLNRMITDLDELNKSKNDKCPPELLARTWNQDDMVWTYRHRAPIR